MNSKPATRKFDEIYEQEGQGLPVAFLRSLAQRESASNPQEQSGPAWGLLQVGIDSRAGNVLQSYNARHGTTLAPLDMLDPRLNVRVASDLLARIVEMYSRVGVKEDWSNGNFVGLVVAGWNSGYSRKAGTLRVISCLQRKNIPITLAAVYRNAEACGATRHLSNPRKQKWQRSVVASFLEAGEGPARSKRESEWLPLLMLAFVLMQ